MKTTGLIKKLALTLALTTTVGLASGCATEAKEKTVANFGADGKCAINNILYVVPETNTEDYYVSFIGHYDTGSKFGGIPTIYYNHKEFRVTYNVSRDEYQRVLSMTNDSIFNFYNADKNDCKFLNQIIDNYDPVEVKEFKKEETDTNHNYIEEYEYQG